MKKRPVNEYDLHLKGFTPLVEESSEGSILRPLPEQTLILPGEITRRSSLVLGLPGSGKSRRVLERAVSSALANPETSVVVFSVQAPSRNQAIAATRFYRGADANIAEWNAGDSRVCSHSINLVSKVRTKSQARDVSELLFANSGEHSHGDDGYFTRDSIDKLTQCMVALQRVRSGGATLADLKDVLDGGGPAISDLATRAGSGSLKRWADELISQSRNPETTLTMMIGMLGSWDDDNVRKATSDDELDFSEVLGRRPGVLIISVQEEQIRKLAAVNALMFLNLFAWIAQEARRNDGMLPRPLYIFIDELPAAGRIPDLGTRLTATFRKANVNCIAAAQAEAQLHAVYKEETPSVLSGFGSRIYVPPLSHLDSEAVSSRMGIIETARTVTDADGRILSSSAASRPLILPGELATPKHPTLGPRIFFCLADVPPFFGYVRGAWEMDEEREILKTAANNLKVRKVGRRTKRRSNARSPESLELGLRPREAWISSTAGWSRAAIAERIAWIKDEIGYESAGTTARGFWDAFELKNADRPHEILRLAEEIAGRGATVEKFYLAALYSRQDDVTAVLIYMDYLARVNSLDRG
jgi:hypothetical protein